MDLTCQHTNHALLVEEPEITIRAVHGEGWQAVSEEPKAMTITESTPLRALKPVGIVYGRCHHRSIRAVGQHPEVARDGPAGVLPHRS